MSKIKTDQKHSVQVGGSRTSVPKEGLSELTNNDEKCLAEKNSSNSNYVPGISFDTVPSFAGVACDDPYYHSDRTLDYTEEEFYDNESSSPERFLNLSPDGKFLMIPSNYIRGASPPPRDYTSLKSLDSVMNGFDGKIFIGDNGQIIRTDYPSRPTIVNDALVLNRAHKNWAMRWQERKEQLRERLASPTTYFQFPEILFPKEKVNIPISTDDYTPLTKEQRKKAKILSKEVGFPNTPRTILCHISGRKHTWVALDWVLKQFCRNIDHLVVVANIPRMSGSGRSRSHSRSRSAAARSRSLGPSHCSGVSSEKLQRTLSAGPGTSENEEKHECFIEWTCGYETAEIKKVLKNILEYITSVLPPNKVIKLAVEIVVGRTKKIMVDATNVYTPDLIVLSTLRSKDTDSLVVWKSKMLTDALCQSLPVPVVIVPVKRLRDFEANLQEELRERTIARDEVLHRAIDEPISHESIDNRSSSQSDYSGTRPSIGERSGTSEYAGGSVTSTISSDSSQSPGNCSSVSISIRNRQDAYRKKASHDIMEIEENKNLSIAERMIDKLDVLVKSTIKFSMELDNDNRSTESFVELKKVLTGNTRPNAVDPRKSMLDVIDKPENQKTPQINIEGPTSPHKKASQIKFAPEVKGKDGHGGLTSGALERTMSCDPSLRPVVSQGTVKPNGDTNLRKVRSTGGLKPIRSMDSIGSDTKKKSRGFFSFLRGSSDSNGGSSKSSRSPSRRNSSASESSGGFSLNSTSSRSKRSSFFGFKS